jgi:hypothetical protein
MGRFTDEFYNRNRKRNKVPKKEIGFECNNCLKTFTFGYEDIFLNSSGDIGFEPEPSCPRCGTTVDIVFDDYGQEKIEDMLFSGQIRKE